MNISYEKTDNISIQGMVSTENKSWDTELALEKIFNSFWHINWILVSSCIWHIGLKKWQGNIACFQSFSIVGLELSPDILSEKLRFFHNCGEITDALVPKIQFTTQKCQVTLLSL